MRKITTTELTDDSCLEIIFFSDNLQHYVYTVSAKKHVVLKKEANIGQNIKYVISRYLFENIFENSKQQGDQKIKKM